MSAKRKKGAYFSIPTLLVLSALALYLIFRVSVEEERPPNVLLITMDSLRFDHLGCTGYGRAQTPNIDALAEDGAVFMDAITQGTFTRISLPSIVSGKFSYSTGVRMLSGALDSTVTTTAEVLLADHYSTLVTGTMWSSSFYQGFAEASGSRLSTTERTERTLQAFEEFKDNKFFIWLYYWDPHAPYLPPVEFMQRYNPDYKKMSAEEQKTAPGKTGGPRDQTGHYNGSIATLLKLNQGKIRLTSLDKEHLLNLYDAEIAYVDAEIGKVVAKLKQMGLYDDTMIILSSDHGEGFGEHDKYYHGTAVYDEMARVPLIIKPLHSKKKKKVVRGQVRNIDIMPTILDYCSLEVPQECNGQSLRPYIEGDVSPDLASITETHVAKLMHLLGFRHRNHKLIYDLTNDEVWLYDLETDPGEKNNLLPKAATMKPAAEESSSPARQKEQELRQELLDLLGLKRLIDITLTGIDLKEIDEKTKEQLKALGYVY